MFIQIVIIYNITHIIIDLAIIIYTLKMKINLDS